MAHTSIFAGRKNGKRILFIGVALAALCLFAACDSENGGSTDDGLAVVSGRAFFPEQVAAGKVAVANAPFQILDFERAAGNELVASGVTDETGAYAAQITQSKIIAVIVSGAVRVSGLISPTPDSQKELNLSKDFNENTDVACEAGVTAIQDGSVSPNDFDDQRIANLEAGAEVVTATTQINHFDPASVTAAAALVRQITDDGDHGPR
jgi:hypothetical protein